jgi:membrane glycosyltransferase
MHEDQLGPRRRLLLAVLVLGGAAIATKVLANVLGADGLSLLECGIVLVFSVTFAWLGYGFWTAAVGFVLTFARRPPHQLKPLKCQAHTAACAPLNSTVRRLVGRTAGP